MKLGIMSSNRIGLIWREMMRIYCILVLITCQLSTSTRIHAEGGYLLTTSATFRADSVQDLSVTILRPKLGVFVDVKLHDSQGNAVATSSRNIYGRGIIKLKIPLTARGRHTLKVCGNCRRRSYPDQHNVYKFYNSSAVFVLEPATSLLIQTDRPGYRPGQLVQINMYQFSSEDFRPKSENLTTYIVDPNDVKMFLWRDLRPACCGTVRISYQLSHHPVLGTWNVVSQLYHDRTYIKRFTVERYDISKFYVKIDSPAYVSDWTACFKVTVKARYVYDEPVQGTVTAGFHISGTDFHKGLSGPVVNLTRPIQGSAVFNVCLKDLYSERFTDYFRGILNVWAKVTPEGGGHSVAVPDSSCIVRHHNVDIEFTEDTRRHFKPGISFSGKVKVKYPDESPAGDVTVEISADVDGKDTVTQRYTSSSEGLIEFNIPKLPSFVRSLWLSARVVMIGDRSTDGTYLPIHRHLSGWYSPSLCHLLAQLEQHPALTVGKYARIRIHSTCVCNFTLYFQITSRGRLVTSGVRTSRLLSRKSAKRKTRVKFIESGDDSSGRQCRAMLKVKVTHEMSPRSQILFYYIREDGEVVADTVTLRVQPQLKNQISLKLPEGGKDVVKPRQKTRLLVEAPPDTLYCVRGVDASSLLSFPNNEHYTSVEQMFEGLDERQIDLPTRDVRVKAAFWDISDGPAISFQHLMSAPSPKDVGFAFEEAGLLVMSDIVQSSTLHNNRLLATKPFYRGLGIQQTGPPNTDDERQKVKNRSGPQRRSYFPETWFYSCYNSSSDSTGNELSLTLPDSITTWTLDAVGMSQEYGLGISRSVVHLKSLKRFFIDLNPPQTVIRGERVELSIVLHNLHETCVYTHISLTVPRDIKLLNELPLEQCLKKQERKTLTALIAFDNVGAYNVTAQVSAFADKRCCAENEGRLRLSRHIVHLSDDIVVKEVHVEHDGIVQHKTFSTYFCSNGVQAYSEQISLARPADAVAGSEKVKLIVTGNIIGPSTYNMESLLQLPFGCGEQNMIHFTPIVYILRHLKSMGRLTNDTLWKAKNYLSHGYQNQMSYRRIDGSYSPFGDKDSYGSLWLTALVIKSYTQARDLIYIDENELKKSVSWLISQQTTGGAFQPTGRAINKNIQGGQKSSLIATAYVSAALASLSTDYMTDRLSLGKAQKFIEENLYSANDSYTKAVIAYALARLKSKQAAAAIDLLIRSSIEKDGMRYWKAINGPEDIEEDSDATAADIETTGYALLALTLHERVLDALPVARWLSAQRNPFGGFASTQDTLVALEALTEFISLWNPHKKKDLRVHVTSSDKLFQRKYRIDDITSDVMMTSEISKLPTELLLRAHGTGCALLQADIRYATKMTKESKPFELTVKASKFLNNSSTDSELIESIIDSMVSDDPGSLNSQELSGTESLALGKRISLKICTKFLLSNSSNMAIIDVAVPTGYQPEISSVEEMMKRNTIIKLYEWKDRNIIFYLDEVLRSCRTCISFVLTREHLVNGEKSVYIKVYDYYEPERMTTVWYNIDRTSLTGDSNTNCDPSNQQGNCLSKGQNEATDDVTCQCARDCSVQSERHSVCASNGKLYADWCRMEMDACMKQEDLSIVPMINCHFKINLQEDDYVEAKFSEISISSDLSMRGSSVEESIEKDEQKHSEKRENQLNSDSEVQDNSNKNLESTINRNVEDVLEENRPASRPLTTKVKIINRDPDANLDEIRAEQNLVKLTSDVIAYYDIAVTNKSRSYLGENDEQNNAESADNVRVQQENFKSADNPEQPNEEVSVITENISQQNENLLAPHDNEDRPGGLTNTADENTINENSRRKDSNNGNTLSESRQNTAKNNDNESEDNRTKQVQNRTKKKAHNKRDSSTFESVQGPSDWQHEQANIDDDFYDNETDDVDIMFINDTVIWKDGKLWKIFNIVDLGVTPERNPRISRTDSSGHNYFDERSRLLRFGRSGSAQTNYQSTPNRDKTRQKRGVLGIQ